MVRVLHAAVLLFGFPLLIFGESVVGLPLMSIFLFLWLTLKVPLFKRMWWLLYVSSWLALWYHTWWWQTILLLSILLLCTKLLEQHRWVFGWLIFLSVLGTFIFNVLFVQLTTGPDVLLVMLQVIGSSLFWWWLWRHWGSLQRSTTWYIR